ncbi:protein kinase domain-containing protein [Sorangium sp. So ce124]|uniref:serine/threonine-protein kinase n=1 Tax=Sorangium sp. So ce124 TaxID=3133280 RepID=UPI003F5F17F5
MLSLEAGSVVGGKYRLERPLSGGAMGFLWVARHLHLDVEVALKFMMPQHADSPVARARFEREAKASAQLRTPNVVHVYDYGLEGDTPYLAMELLEGEDLAAYLARHGRLEPEELLGIVSQVSKALRRAHEVGLIHRDLKPANIFLARQGEEIVKILDFGVAKATGTGLAADATKTGTLIGSPHYMSPEQVRRSKTIDFRSDLWSLGVIIFQCLTGQLPFPGEELGDVLVEICTGDIPVASQLAPNLWPELDRFLERALKREPAERFQSASELARAFAAAVQRSGVVPDSRDSLDSTEALVHGVAPARASSPGSGGAPAPGGAPAHGIAQALGIAPTHGVAPAVGGGTVALDDAVTAGGTLTAGGTVVADRTQVPGGIVGPGDTLAAGGTLTASGTLEAVGGALSPPVDRRAPSRAPLAVAASVLVVGLGIAAVVLLRSPAPEVTAAPAAASPPHAPGSAAPPARVEEVPSPPPPDASAVPATSASSAPAGADAASAAPSPAPPSGSARATLRSTRPSAPPPARRPSQAAPSNRGTSEKDPTFGF